MKALNIIATAYRATLEEQDDTILWLSHAMKGAGADLAVLLRGAAVNYAVRTQDASGLAFGELKQTQPPRIADDLIRLIEKGVAVHYLEEDLATRGLRSEELLAGVRAVKTAGLAALFEQFDRVWHW